LIIELTVCSLNISSKGNLSGEYQTKTILIIGTYFSK
jgi:hypothetical protein